MKSSITVQRTQGKGPDLGLLLKQRVYVGIPSSAARRQSKPGNSPLARIKSAFGEEINNAQLLFLHTNGIPTHGVPPRPVVEPAVRADGNRESISRELKASGQAAIKGDAQTATVYLRRAGIAGQNAAKAWFTDGRNGWPPNAPSTIRRKGSDRPLIDTGQLRNDLTYVLLRDKK